jgi:hypothetical protein
MKNAIITELHDLLNCLHRAQNFYISGFTKSEDKEKTFFTGKYFGIVDEIEDIKYLIDFVERLAE